MNLKDFVTDALVGVMDGIAEAQERLAAHSAEANPSLKRIPTSGIPDNLFGTVAGAHLRPVHMMEFDVAVTVGGKSEGKGSIGIEVAGFGMGGAVSAHQENVPRIRFRVPVTYPQQRPEKE